MTKNGHCLLLLSCRRRRRRRRRRRASCVGSSGSNSTWPCRVDARFGSGSIFYRSLNARATCRSKRSPRFPRTRSFVQGDQHAYVWHLVTITWRLDGRCQPFLNPLGRFIPLVRDAAAWRKVHLDEPTAESTLPSGTLQTYSKRGWCKFMVDSSCPVHHSVTRHLYLCVRPLGNPRRNHTQDLLARRLATGAAQC